MDLAATAGGHKKQQHPRFRGESKAPVGLFKNKSEKINLFSQEIQKTIVLDENHVIFYFQNKQKKSVNSVDK